MFMARVKGNVVSTQKVRSMQGMKLLIIEPYSVDEAGKAFKPTGRAMVAVDAVGAGTGEMVLITQGSSARMTDVTGKAPVDAVIIGIMDTVSFGEMVIYEKSGNGRNES